MTLECNEIRAADISGTDSGTHAERDGKVFRVVRPRSYWDVVGVHFPLVLAMGIIWLASFILPHVNTSIRLCTFYNWTGYPCLFCGFSRAFSAISGGHWTWAWHHVPMSYPLYMVMLAVLFWNAAALACGVQLYPGRVLRRIRVRWVVIVFGVLLMANWIYRLSRGLS